MPSESPATEAEIELSPEGMAVLERADRLCGHSGLTSSALLFALASPGIWSPFSEFVQRLLNRRGGLDDTVRRFEETDRIKDFAQSNAAFVAGLPWRMTPNMRSILLESKRIATQAGSDRVGPGHMFEGLLRLKPLDDPPRAWMRMEELGVHPQMALEEFRSAFSPVRSRERIESQKRERPDPPPPPGTPFQQSYAAYANDHLRHGEPLEDRLGVTHYAGHFAQLIAAKTTAMPLSIGLFGSWGSGKSHFIGLLDQQIHAMTGTSFHTNIVSIRFNAWHYLDTNLWASLVSEIFDQLFTNLNPQPDALAALKKKLAEQSSLKLEAEEAKRIAEAARGEAEKNLQIALDKRRDAQNRVDTLLDDLANIVTEDNLKTELRAVSEQLGLPKLKSSFSELESSVREAGSLAGRVRVVMLGLMSGSNRWLGWLLFLGAVFLVPLIVGAFGKWGQWPELNAAVLQIASMVAAVAAWLLGQLRQAGSFVEKMESTFEKVKAKRRERENSDEAKKAQAELAAKQQAEDAARKALEDAETKLNAIRAELAELAPGRQLLRFLKERATAEDYRRHLGLVSLVRRDFERLSQLLTDVAKQEDKSLPQIDRIVLYIDDLDRCRADRVIEVLEAVHLLLAFPLFAVVVAVDPRWLRQSLLDHYPKLLGDGGAAPRAVRPASPQDYLEKVFQVPFQIQSMEKAGFASLVQSLFPFEAMPTPTLDPAAGMTISPRPEGIGPSLPAPPPPPPPPPTPEPIEPKRLTLLPHELEDFQRFQPLFTTPRAVKRLANTYCLIRVAIGQGEWSRFVGTAESPGEYRVPMLLLAVAAAFPSLAQTWFKRLRVNGLQSWSEPHEISPNEDRDGFQGLYHSLGEIDLGGWPKPDASMVQDWLPRVARYSF